MKLREGSVGHSILGFVLALAAATVWSIVVLEACAYLCRVAP